MNRWLAAARQDLFLKSCLDGDVLRPNHWRARFSSGAVSSLLARPAVAEDFAVAVEAAMAAECASHDIRNTLSRVSYVLCEVANQLRQQTGSLVYAATLPTSRDDLSGLLGVSLFKVKRVLALLSLSGVIATDGRRVEVLDWRRLSGVGRVDPERLGLPAEEEEELAVAFGDEDEEPASLVTANGEPACFV